MAMLGRLHNNEYSAAMMKLQDGIFCLFLQIDVWLGDAACDVELACTGTRYVVFEPKWQL
jgi:hypothetical protein